MFGEAEKKLMHASIDSGWLTSGDYVAKFEHDFAKATGHDYALACNSGSSANLIAVAMMVEAGIWKKGDEILCVAASFPTTVNPLLMYGLVPVFVDIELGSYSVNQEELKAARNNKTRGVMIAHTLGSPYDLDWMADFCSHWNLPIIEDCCDALGSRFRGKDVGSIGHAATFSFYPAHHITTGEGGAVCLNNPNLMRIARSVRDWGRSCYCLSSQEGICGKRFEQQLGTLPFGFDHKYTYSALGYNLKMAEVSAACGIAQVGRLFEFHQQRKLNVQYYNEAFADLENELILPRGIDGADPSWFGYPITIRKTGLRRELQMFLDDWRISTRLIFGGDLTRQPYMQGRNFRIASTLEVTEKVMNDALWLGVYPGITKTMIDFVSSCVHEFFRSHQ
jgi:CDP-6-deoxy-D-xylo-4-hexulose-3-dehydrase